MLGRGRDRSDPSRRPTDEQTALALSVRPLWDDESSAGLLHGAWGGREGGRAQLKDFFGFRSLFTKIVSESEVTSDYLGTTVKKKKS